MRTACLIGAVLLSAGVVRLSSQQAPLPTFRAETTHVEVDAVVTTPDGEPVTDLTAADFEVREDGVPQAISTFALAGAAPAMSSARTSG